MGWKKLWKLLFPPFWLLLLLTGLSAAGLTGVFLQGWETAPISYAVYVLSFYTLCAVTAFCVVVLPKRYRQIKERVLANPLGNRYLTEREFRGKVSLYLSLGINLLYVGIHLLSWYLYRSWWFACLAVYYGILSVMRFLLVRYVRLHKLGANRRGELKRSLACSWIMLLLNVFLSAAVLMMVYRDKGYEYHGILIYVAALYTFYTVVHAIVNLIKYRSFNSPVMSTAKSISMAAALVSLLNLETAMFAAFGDQMAKADQQMMIELTGGGISVAVIVMAVCGILRCTKEMKKMRDTEHG